MKKLKTTIKWAVGCLALPVAGILAFGLFWYVKWADDFSRLRKEEYDTVFFSMYPTDNYEEGDYAYFRAMQIVKTSYAMPDSRIMKLYMDVAASSRNTIQTAYLGINPELVNTEDIFEIVLGNPTTMFEIVLSYPQIEYWLAKDDAQVQAAMDAYRDFAGMVLGLENVRVYYFGNAEWLLCNPANYVDTFNTNKEVSQLVMCNSDYQHNFILNVENFHVRFNQAQQIIDKYKGEPLKFADASDWEILFIGDSVFGNYEGSLSIPGVVNAFTGAAVYNCGYGGRSAALTAKTDTPVPVVAEAIISRDLSAFPTDSQPYKGIIQFLQADHTGKKQIFVINHGLNDYFEGVPVANEDPKDIATYCGALRVAVAALQEAFPDAEIVLQTPNFTASYDSGRVARSEEGGVYEEYVVGMLALAEERGTRVLNHYYELPITEKNYYHYLSDQCHPNEQGRFMMGVRFCELLEDIIQE